MGGKKASSTDIIPSPVSEVERSAPAGGAEPFEVLIERLEGLVGRLEDGDLSLEDSLKAYEEGIRAVREAQGRLDAMDARLEQLTRDGRVVALENKPVGDPGSLKQPPPAEPTEFDDTDF
jgi:exodeoxyribonuclease VII small subunit